MQQILSFTKNSSGSTCLEQTHNNCSSFGSSNNHTSLQNTKDIDAEQYSLQSNINCISHESETTPNVLQSDNENLSNEDNASQNTKNIDSYHSCLKNIEETDTDNLYKSELEMHNHSSTLDHNYSNTKDSNLDEVSHLKDTVDISLENIVEDNTCPNETTKLSVLHLTEKRINDKSSPDKRLISDSKSTEDIYNSTKNKKDDRFSEVQASQFSEDTSRKRNDLSNTETNNLNISSESSSYHNSVKFVAQENDVSDNKLYFNNSQSESSIDTGDTSSDFGNIILITSESDLEDGCKNSEENQNDTCSSSFKTVDNENSYSPFSRGKFELLRYSLHFTKLKCLNYDFFF